MDTTIFVSFPCSFSPVEIFIPFNMRLLQTIKLAHAGNCATKIERTTVLKKIGEVLVYNPAFLNRRKNHAHNSSR